MVLSHRLSKFWTHMRRWLRELLRQKSSYNNSYRMRKMQGIGSKVSHKITARFPRLENSFKSLPLVMKASLWISI